MADNDSKSTEKKNTGMRVSGSRQQAAQVIAIKKQKEKQGKS